MSLANVLLVLRKELLQFARDRRALTLLLAFPVVVFPLVTIAIHITLTVALRQSVFEFRPRREHARQSSWPAARVWVRALAAQPPELVASLRKVREFHRPLEVEDEPPGADEREALAEHRVHAIVHAPPTLALEIAAIATTSRIEIVYDHRNRVSVDAESAAWTAVYEWSEEIVRARFAERGVRRNDFLFPLKGEVRDIAETSVEGSGSVAAAASGSVAGTDSATVVFATGHVAERVETIREPIRAVLGGVVALFVVLSMLVSAHPPALEFGCGEKERGTLETLLLAPESRAELVLGKCGAVTIVALANVVLCLGSSWLSSSPMEAALPQQPGIENAMSVFAPRPVDLLAILSALAPLACFLSALLLALSTLAKSEKEAAVYLNPLIVATILLAGAGAVPIEEYVPGVHAVPILGSCVLSRQLVAGTASIRDVAVVWGTSLLYALVALRWVLVLYDREDVLVRPSVAPGFGVLERGPGQRTPGPAHALLLGIVTLVLLWGVGIRLQAAPHELSGLAATLVLIVAAPGVLYAAFLRVDLRETFRLRAPSLAAAVAPVLVALGTIVLARDVFSWQTRLTGELLPEERAAWEGMSARLLEHGLSVAVLLLAVLPALAEELLFRGFLLSGLRARWRGATAVAVSSAFFALSHLDPSRFGVTLALGVVLAVLTLRSGSLLPAVLAHALHNGGAIVLGDRIASAAGDGWAARALAVALVLAGLYLSGAGEATTRRSASRT